MHWFCMIMLVVTDKEVEVTDWLLLWSVVKDYLFSILFFFFPRRTETADHILAIVDIRDKKKKGNWFY